MKKILVLFAHPALEKSRIHKQLIVGLEQLEHVTFHDLYEAYPELDIDVDREQQLMQAHDIVIMQHPFFWYSTPAMLKIWQDLVLEHGWAYGANGTALQGKWLLNVMTTGGQEIAYCKEGFNKYTIGEFLRPLERTAILCNMEYLPPYVLYGTHSIAPDAVKQHRGNYHRLLELLAGGQHTAAEWHEYANLADYFITKKG